MVGAGVFVLSALAAERAGPASAVSYAIAGGICLLVALGISELATGMPRAGGSYTFIAQALGPWPDPLLVRETGWDLRSPAASIFWLPGSILLWSYRFFPGRRRR